MRRLIITLIIGAGGAAILAGGGGARDAVTVFKCPASPTAKPQTLWVKNYTGGLVGSTWCSDGATASVTLVGRLASNNKLVASATLSFTGGLCTRSKSNGSRYLQFGTRISPLDKRRAKDPPGLFVNDVTTKTGGEDYGQIGKTTDRWPGKLVKWQENVKFTWGGALSGKFSGTEGQWIDTGSTDEYTLVKATGTFTCKRWVPVL